MPSPDRAPQKKSTRAWIAAGVLVLVAAVTFLTIGTPRSAKLKSDDISDQGDTQGIVVPKGSAYTPPSDDGYVGSRACVECHRSIAEAYQSHPMAHSIAALDPHAPEMQTPSDEARVYGKSRYFQVEMQDGQMVHHERMADAKGDLIYDQAVPMDFVVGSGKRAKAYLFQEGPVLFMSPLNWYTQAGKWDLAPGYVPDDPRRFDRRVTDECLSCHAGRVATVGRSLNTYRVPPFHEMAIGCESCHGPGEKHVTIRASGKSIADGIDPIVNPSKLDASRRESVCNQCHLQVAVRLTRPGRSDLDFRPGQDLDDIWTFLDIKRPITPDGRTHSVNHVQQMRESRCFSRSDGRFGCVSCHDPHSVPTKETLVSFYRSKCLKCHEETTCSETMDHRQQQGDSCTACHMPARQSSNISHVTQTDHRVIREKTSNAGESTGDDASTLTLIDNQNHRLSPYERDRAVGLGAWARLTKTGHRPSRELAQFLDKLVAQSPEDGPLLTALGSMAHQGNRPDLARGYLERASRIPAAEEAAIAELLDIFYESSDWENALQCANRLIEINPREFKGYALKADALSFMGKTSEGITAAQKALELNPSLISVRRWLAAAYLSSGREPEARAEEIMIHRIENARSPSKN
jgi:predicted CXXCH cytochrome family protein